MKLLPSIVVGVLLSGIQLPSYAMQPTQEYIKRVLKVNDEILVPAPPLIEEVLEALYATHKIGTIDYNKITFYIPAIGRIWSSNFHTKKGDKVNFKQLFTQVSEVIKNEDLQIKQVSNAIITLKEELDSFMHESEKLNGLGLQGYRSKKFTFLNSLLDETIRMADEENNGWHLVSRQNSMPEIRITNASE